MIELFDLNILLFEIAQSCYQKLGIDQNLNTRFARKIHV